MTENGNASHFPVRQAWDETIKKNESRELRINVISVMGKLAISTEFYLTYLYSLNLISSLLFMNHVFVMILSSAKWAK